MALTDRLSRYRDFGQFLMKYGRTDFTSPEAAASTADAEAFARDIEALGPTFIKLGQILSTHADILPPAYIEALARLQDNVAPFPHDEAVAIVEAELGVRLSKAFRHFEVTPLAAASLGQVHRATLRSGREVAVKVQRPNVQERVRQDLEALDELVGVLGRFTTATRHIDLPRVLDEFRHTLLCELDYRQEARNLAAIAHRLRDIDGIVLPLPVDDYTTSRVLTMDYIDGTKVTDVSAVEWTEVDGSALADALFRAYLQQILVDGFFHADPHPGNVLLTPDRHLALIDLGMVGHVSGDVQERLFRLLLAISDARADAAATIVIELGERLEDFDEAHVRRMVTEMVGRSQAAPVKDLNIGRVMLDVVHRGNRFGLRMAPELALLGKTLLNLHAIGRTLDPEFDISRSMRRNATTLMRRRMAQAATPAHLFASSLTLRDFAERLPARINRVLDALSANDLRLKIEVIDHGSIIEGLQKVANRIALGLVLAALIVGAALLLRVPTRFTILGYPGLSMLLFIAAAAGGVWMAVTILLHDVKRSQTQ